MKQRSRPDIRAEEEWARRIIARTLNRTVEANDVRGGLPGAYDLRIDPAHAPEVAIECVGAVDQVAVETWNVGPGRGPLKLGTAGDWHIEIDSDCDIKVLREGIATLLRQMEGCECYNTFGDLRSVAYAEGLLRHMDRLGIKNAYCYRRQGSGVLHWTTPGVSGMVDERGVAVPGWIDSFLRDPMRQDVLSKLECSGAPMREVFVFIVERGAPWLVTSYLDGSLTQTPSDPPSLPWPITGVWVMSVYGERGIRWDGGSWHMFRTRGEGIDA